MIVGREDVGMSDKGPRTSERIDGYLSGSESALPSVSERCELLASARRRAVLRYLAGRPGDLVSVADLADRLASGEPTASRREVATSLHHVHLPKLADAGVIRYDPERWRVEYVPHDDLEDLLAFLDDR